MECEIKYELGINAFAWQSATCGFKRQSNKTSSFRDIAYLPIDWLGGVLVWEVVDCVDNTFCNATKHTVNTHYNTLHAFLMMAVGPPTQNSMLNFAAQGFNLRMLNVQLAITKKSNLTFLQGPPLP
jgi:hypothetical protein